MERANKKRTKNVQKAWWLNPVINGGIGFSVLMLAVILSPLVLIKTEDPNSLAFVAAVVSVFIGSAVSGILNGIQSQNKDMISPLISGGLILLLIVTISLFYKSEFDLIEFFIIFGVIFAASFLPTLIMGNMKSNNKRNLKKVMKRR